jgi:hypothetical protein
MQGSIRVIQTALVSCFVTGVALTLWHQFESRNKSQVDSPTEIVERKPQIVEHRQIVVHEMGAVQNDVLNVEKSEKVDGSTSDNVAAVNGNPYDSALKKYEEVFSREQSDKRKELDNEKQLREVIKANDLGNSQPIKSFECRGDSCRVTYGFRTIDEMNALLNGVGNSDTIARNYAFRVLPLDFDSGKS